jgi:hypothetical protein
MNLCTEIRTNHLRRCNMEIIDNRNERIVGKAFHEPTMETGGITANPQYQGETGDHTVQDGGIVHIDNLEKRRGKNEPSDTRT